MLVRRRTPSLNPALLLLALSSVVVCFTAFSSVSSARMTPPVLYVPDGQGHDDPYAAPPTSDPKLESLRGTALPMAEPKVLSAEVGNAPTGRSTMTLRAQIFANWLRVIWLGK